MSSVVYGRFYVELTHNSTATGSGSEPVADYIPDLKISALNQKIDPVTFSTAGLPTMANYHIQGLNSLRY